MRELDPRFTTQKLNRSQIEHGLALWRRGVRRFDREPAGSRKDAYGDAIQNGVGFLRRYHTVKELVCTYFDYAFLGENDVDDDGRDPFDTACDLAEEVYGHAHLLSPSIVEDVAYFRRLQELVQAL